MCNKSNLLKPILQSIQKGLIVFACLLFAWVVSAQTPVQQHGALSVSGNRVVNANGQSFSLAGNSFFWSNNGWGGERYYNADVVNWLKDDWNSPIVRAAMGVEDGGGYIDDAAGNKQKVQTVVDAAIAAGLYVIIDWHSHHAEDYQSQAVSFFQEMATQYGSYDNVIYEVYNEPLQVSWSNTIKPYAQAVVDAIRAIDADNLIVVGTPTWSQDVDVASNDPLSGSNIAYTLHFYAGTHGQSLRDKATTAMNNGVALFATEWGTVNANGDGAVDYNSTNTWMDFLKNNGISHCNWSVNDKDEGASALVPGASTSGGWSAGDLTESGTFVKDIILNWDGNGSGCSRTNLPAMIQAEDWCAMNGVQTETTTDTGGGLNVGWIDAGDWMEYDVHVPSAGSYTFDFRVASQPGGGAFELKNGGSVVTSASVPNTGGWQNWTTVSTSASLPAGDLTLRLEATSGGWNVNWIDFISGSGGGNSTIVVRSRGNCGGENLELRVDDAAVANWSVTTSTADYTFTNFTGGNVKVAFTNDANSGCDLNLFVDYIDIDGTQYQTESVASRTGCGDSQWLWCNGHFDFGSYSGGGTVPVTGVSVSPGSASLSVGETQQLTATISPSNATNQNVTWSSSNSSVASVNSSGLVTANASGSATIAATTEDGGYTDNSDITVPSSTLTVRARGNCGPEIMELRINDVTVNSWTVTTSLSDYTYSSFNGGNVKVAFVNDDNSGCDRNLFVDYVQVGSTVYQTESSATRTGCGDTQWLWCNGHFDFGTLSAGGRLEDSAAILSLEDPRDHLLPYPNPLRDGYLTVELPSKVTDVHILDISGKILWSQAATKPLLRLHKSKFVPGVYIIRTNGPQGRSLKFRVE